MIAPGFQEVNEMDAEQKIIEPKAEVWGVFLNDRGALMIDRSERRIAGFICISGPKPSRKDALEYASNYVDTVDKGACDAVPSQS